MDNSHSLDAKAAARYIGCSEAAIRLWKRQGKLRFFRAGRLVRFRREDLNAWIEENSAGGQDLPYVKER